MLSSEPRQQSSHRAVVRPFRAVGRHRPAPPPGLAKGVFAELGGWCFRHWRVAVLAWVVVVVAGVLSFEPLFDAQADYAADVESSEGRDLLDAAATDGGSIIALVDGVDPQAPGVCDAVGRLAADLNAHGEGVKKVVNPCETSVRPVAVAPTYRSADGGAFLVTATLVKTDDSAAVSEAVDTVSDRMRQLAAELRAAGQPQARVRVGGGAAFESEYSELLAEDSKRVEMLSLPLSFILLVVVFRGLVGAFVPVLTATVASMAAMVALLGFAMVISVAPSAVTIVTLLSLGLSIDYGLLLVGRYREEVMAGHLPHVAVSRACATAGRTIMFSGLTVTASLTGLLVLGLVELATTGAAAVSIAMIAVLIALTFTPALLGGLRPWLTPPRRGARRASSDDLEVSFFARLARVVQRRPAAVAVVTTAMLLAAGLPLLDTTLRVTTVEGVPGDVESVQVLDELASRFGIRQDAAVTVVARADQAAALGGWARRWANDPVVSTVGPATQVSPGLATVTIDVAGDPKSEAAQDLVRRIRADRPPDAASWVTGGAALIVDLKDRLVRNGPLAVGGTVLAMLIVLFLMTGSVLVPVKAVLASVISLGATFGTMNAVFERGYLTGPLDLLQTGGLDPYIMVIVFAFAFGLAMDYEVFLLGRIQEYVGLGYPTDAAIRRGMAHTGRVITSAALLMIIVFASFASGRMGVVEQLGFGLTVAVLVDATIVRCLLVPATMTLMGRWNWWAPAPLRRLHERLGLREATLPDAAAPHARP